MQQTISISPSDLKPRPDSVLKQMGVPGGAAISGKVFDMVEDAIGAYVQCVEPRGLLAIISREGFTALYSGEGKNARDTPLKHIARKADSLAVFALTLGGSITNTIEAHSASGNIAEAGTLNAVASVAADSGGEFCEQFFLRSLAGSKQSERRTCVLAYSPGYCGWHVSGQRKLFQFLKPERIGVTLNEQCLMTPLKSVSGVLVAGSEDIHTYKPHWQFCETCAAHSCLARMKRLKHTALHGERYGC